MKELLEWLGTEKGKNIILSGWRSAGIMDNVKNAQSGQIASLNLYVQRQFHKHCLLFGFLQLVLK
jgi:ABC-type Fe3+ transport system substrate-binding protein